jgi:hypothetical protein
VHEGNTLAVIIGLAAALAVIIGLAAALAIIIPME